MTTLTDKLTAWSTPSARFPFFKKWCEQSGGTLITVSGVPLAVCSGDPSKSGSDLWLRAVYWCAFPSGGMEQMPVDIYVTDYGTPNEAAYQRGQASYRVTLAGLATAMGDPIKATAIYAALQAATSNAMAQVFVPLLNPATGPGIDILDPATAVGIAALVTEQVLTADQQSAILNCPLPFFV